MSKFWYISRDPSTVGYHDPKKAYFTREEAKNFAESMVKKTGHDFYVMEAVELVRLAKPPVEWIAVPTIKEDKRKYNHLNRPRNSLGQFMTTFSSDY